MEVMETNQLATGIAVVAEIRPYGAPLLIVDVEVT